MPLVFSVSALEPASIQMPTVEVCAHGECSVAICYNGLVWRSLLLVGSHTVRPFERVVDSVLAGVTGLAYLRNGATEFKALLTRLAFRKLYASLCDAILSFWRER